MLVDDFVSNPYFWEGATGAESNTKFTLGLLYDTFECIAGYPHNDAPAYWAEEILKDA